MTHRLASRPDRPAIAPRLLLVLVAGAAASCTTGLRSSAPAVVSYVLRAAPAGAPSEGVAGASSVPTATPGAASAASLRVLRPLAGPGLDSDHIALARSDRRLAWYAASRWAAPLPDMLEALAVETFRRAGSWSAVEGSRGIAVPDDLLEIVIRRFEADEAGSAGPPTVRVALDCTLVRREDRMLVASFTVERAVPASENRLGAVVEAFEHAADAALAAVAERAAPSVRTSRVPSPP